MNRAVALFFVLILTGFSLEAIAGPLEEVSQLAAPRGKLFEEGTAEAYAAPFADNAVLTSSLSGFRIEGKEAIRAYFAAVFEMYPVRRLFSRQPIARAYNDNLVVQNSYNILYLTDEQGQTTQLTLRGSVVWAKVGGRWQIVEQHVSRMPLVH